MYELKTKVNDYSINEFIETLENPRKREEAYRLLEIFSEATGLEAKMWGDSMIGFGSYHYKYASGHEGDTFLVGFSQRKAKRITRTPLVLSSCKFLFVQNVFI